MRDTTAILNLVVALCVGTTMMNMLVSPEVMVVVAALIGVSGAALLAVGLGRQVAPALQPAVIQRRTRR